MVPPTTPMQQWKGRFKDWRHSDYTEMAKHSEYVQNDARIPGNGPANMPGNASNHFPGNNSSNIKPSTAGPTTKNSTPKKSNDEPNMSTYAQRKKAQPTGEQLQRLARFDWLLRTLLNTLDAIHNEFGGIPDEIQIVRDRFDRHIAQAHAAGYNPDDKADENNAENPARQLDLSKLAIEKSIDIDKISPNFPKAMPRSIVMLPNAEVPKVQYTISPTDGAVELPPALSQGPEYVKEEQILNILQFLKTLENTPLGFAKPMPSAVLPEVTDGKITLSGPHLSIVHDALTVVRYMNDFSPFSESMYTYTRAALIRTFGWAPDVETMIKAKERAVAFRQESGRHVTALGTKAWIGEAQKARNKGECRVFKPTAAKHQQGLGNEKSLDGEGKKSLDTSGHDFEIFGSRSVGKSLDVAGQDTDMMDEDERLGVFGVQNF